MSAGITTTEEASASGGPDRSPGSRLARLLRAPFWSDERRRARVPWLIALPLVGAFAASFLGGPVYGRLPLPVVQLVASAAPAVAAIALILPSRRFLGARRGLAGYGLAIDRRWLIDLVAGLGIGVAAVSVPYLLGMAAGWVEVAAVLDQGDLALWPGIMVYALAMLFTGFWEELVLRGVFVGNAADGLRRWLSPRRAIAGGVAVSAAVFGLAHLAQPAHPAFIVTWVLSGVVLGVVYVLSGNLALPIGAHAAFNITLNTLFARTEIAGLEGLSAIMRIDVDPSLAFLGIGGILDATAHLLVGVIALLWLWRSRGGLSLDAGALAVA